MDFKKLIQSSERIFVLTGAGVSTEAGIPDFQSTDETWQYDKPRHEVMSRSFFNQNPRLFWKIYREVFALKMSEQTPTSFHRWLAELESDHTVNITTQNVDGLHTAAGSTNVIEAHGNISRVVCARITCSRRYDRADFENMELPRCPHCNKVLKPDVSLFQEGITGYGESLDLIAESDLVIVAGTSLDVGPINQLPLHAELTFKKPLLWINRDTPPDFVYFNHMYLGSLGDFVTSMK